MVQSEENLSPEINEKHIIIISNSAHLKLVCLVFQFLWKWKTKIIEKNIIFIAIGKGNNSAQFVIGGEFCKGPARYRDPG